MPKSYNKSLQEHMKKKIERGSMISPRAPFCRTSEATLRSDNKTSRTQLDRFKTRRYPDIEENQIPNQVSSVMSEQKRPEGSKLASTGKITSKYGIIGMNQKLQESKVTLDKKVIHSVLKVTMGSNAGDSIEVGGGNFD